MLMKRIPGLQGGKVDIKEKKMHQRSNKYIRKLFPDKKGQTQIYRNIE